MTARLMDRILIALGVVLILISSYRLFFVSGESLEGQKLGTLTSTFSVVKTKRALSLDWRDASTGNDLANNQLIYTDNVSSAEISFIEGSTLSVGENSLIKLRSENNEEGLDISKGFITARLKEDSPLKVQMNGENYLLTGKDADIQINLQGKTGEIGVLKGEVEFKSETETKNLDEKTALEITGDTITTKTISLDILSPINAKKYYTLTESARILFKWSPEEVGEVTLSKKANLEGGRTFSGRGSVLSEVPVGLWYAKVQNKTGSSLIRSFRVEKEVAPEILRPKDGSTITLFQEDGSKVLLQWKAIPGLKYLVEWRDQSLHSEEVSSDSLSITAQSSGEYSWRLKVSDPERDLAPYSNWQKLQVTVVPKLLPPTDLSPDEVEFQKFDKTSENVDISWKGEGSFELEIQDPQGNTQSESTTENSLTYLAQREGKYQWRIKTKNKFQKVSEWSEWKSFTLKDLSDSILESGAQRFQLEKPDQSVTFEWKSPEGALSVFELAKDPEFKTIVRKIENSSNEAKVNIPEVGAYYWRSRTYLPDGTLNVSEPKRVIIEKSPAPLKPQKLPEMEVPITDASRRKNIFSILFDFIIPSAVADENQGAVKIKLPVKEEAKAFVVRIYRDPEMKEMVFEEELPDRNFVWLNAHPGVFYWQYAIVDFWDRKSPFSDLSKLTVTGEVEELPVRPRLLSPIRASEVDKSKLNLRWRLFRENSRHEVEVSRTRDFKKILVKKETKDGELDLSGKDWEEGLYYWRVRAFNKKNKTVLSNTGRFTILPPKERTVIQDFPLAQSKTWKSRFFVAWAPSKDTYEFKDGKSGKIDGTALNSVMLSGNYFLERYVLNGELLRQSGKVFEEQDYLFQRVLVDGIYSLSNSSTHKWGLGLAIGMTTGQGFSIESNKVKGESLSGASYGPVFRNYYALSSESEIQSRVQYLLGEIKQIDLGADYIRPYKKYLLTIGLGYSIREYQLNSGKQNSLKLSLGVGF